MAKSELSGLMNSRESTLAVGSRLVADANPFLKELVLMGLARILLLDPEDELGPGGNCISGFWAMLKVISPKLHQKYFSLV